MLKYNKEGNKTNIEFNTEMDNVKVSIFGSVEKNGKSYNGNFALTLEESFGKANINYLYNMEYNVPVDNKDVSNSVFINNLTQEEQKEIVINFQESKLYNLINTNINGISGLINNINGGITDSSLTGHTNSISYGNYTVKYNVPYNCEEYYSMDFAKGYVDENINFISAFFEGNIDYYLNNIEKSPAIIGNIEKKENMIYV